MPAADGEAQASFPPAFLNELSQHIPDAEWRDFLLAQAVGPAVERDWRWYLVDGLPNDGALGTDDGFRGVPPLWLWFHVERSPEGAVFLVFNRVATRAPGNDGEDDSD